MRRLFNLIAFAFLGLQGQELPPVLNFSPSVYGAENQNWAISQSEDRLMYIANNKGLLEYNGAQWRLYPSPNQTTTRTVKVVGDRIYMGCYMEFGFWSKNPTGELVYSSISKKFEKSLLPDEEFWNIIEVNGLILFQSTKRIYSFDLEAQMLDFIEAPTAVPRMWQLGQEIYFYVVGEGLFRINQGKKELVLAQNAIANDEVVELTTLNNEALILTRRHGFYIMGDSGVIPWNTSVDAVLKESTAYSALKLQNGSIAVGTIAEGLFLIDGNGELLRHFYMENGLRNNTVLSLFEDQDHDIWLGLDNGVAHIDLNSPFLIYDDLIGDIGSVYTAIVDNGLLYVGTNQGLFFKEVNSAQDFRLVPGTQGQVWQLTKHLGSVFCAHHNGTFIVDGGAVTQLEGSPSGTWNINRLENHTDLLVQGNYNGLYVLERRADSWLLRNKIDGFDNSARFVVTYGDAIFVNHEYKGLFKVDVDKDLFKATQVVLDTLMRGDNSAIARFNDQLLFSDQKGVFVFNDSSRSFERDSVLSQMYSTAEYTSGKMTVINNELWLFTKENLSKVVKSPLSGKPLIERVEIGEASRNSISGYENITQIDQNGNYLIGTGLGYILLDAKKVQERKFTVQLSSALLIADPNSGEHRNQPLKQNKPTDFRSNENNVAFSFYTSHYGKYAEVNYQYRLVGLFENWSDWSSMSLTQFSNLPYGEYTFEVRSKIDDEISENTATYSFVIQKAWYQTNLARAFLVALGLLGLLLIHVANQRHYKKRQQQLEERAAKELRIAQFESEKEIIRLKNEQLNQSVRLKSSELAASTMTLLRKNKVLSEVRDMLERRFTDQKLIAPITQKIDESLSRNDDWELFKEAFNNADKDFLGKLNKAHSNLTQNDIRLCAYLRLNLSSKEIAPLFNISAKSVEVKRYRLRKKMGLQHDENLVDYILNL